MDKQAKADQGALLPTSIADGWIERLTKFYLIPEGPFLANWDRFMVLLTVVSSILISFMAAFKHFTVGAWIVCYAIDVFFLVDIYIKFHVAYLQNGFWVFPKEMALHYLYSMEFKLDVLFSLPTDIVALGWAGTGWQTFCTLAIRLLAFFRRQEKKLHASSVVQIVKFAAYLITLTTLSLASEAEHCKTPWEFGYRVQLGSLYVESVYWTVTTMTTTGYGDITPQNDSERIFAFFTQTAGIFFYNYVSVVVFLTKKMDAVRQYMNDLLDYYDYMWERNKGIDIKNLFEDMPSTFRSEVGLSLNNAIIEKVRWFSLIFLRYRMISISMKLYLFTADEYVVHRGDLGLEMYFITQGRIDIYSSDDMKRPTASLVEGAHFGEFQIILGYRHEYSARAVCNTDIYVLFKNDLQSAFEAYPEDKELVINATRNRYTQAVSARKSRKATSMNDLEEEFGIGTEAPMRMNPSEFDSNPPSAGGVAVPYKNRKQSIANPAFLMPNKLPTSSSAIDIKSGHSRDTPSEQKKKGHKSLPIGFTKRQTYNQPTSQLSNNESIDEEDAGNGSEANKLNESTDLKLL
ncbi:cyclic nucleotide-binding-like protein [Chytridium lagenaria]|nr:cyclic nucleotide-binding-like protein [Chytridium lagenaria]